MEYIPIYYGPHKKRSRIRLFQQHTDLQPVTQARNRSSQEHVDWFMAIQVPFGGSLAPGSMIGDPFTDEMIRFREQ